MESAIQYKTYTKTNITDLFYLYLHLISILVLEHVNESLGY